MSFKNYNLIKLITKCRCCYLHLMSQLNKAKYSYSSSLGKLVQVQHWPGFTDDGPRHNTTPVLLLYENHGLPVVECNDFFVK